MAQHACVNDELADQYRVAMRNFPATVCVVTARRGEVDHGMTATAVCSVSMDPPSLLVCLSKTTLLHDMLLKTALFAVNVLGAGDQDISVAFSGGVPPEDRFKSDAWVRDSDGLFIYTAAPAVLVCNRKAAVPFGTHTLFIGEVETVTTDTSAETLVYADASYCGVVPLPSQ